MARRLALSLIPLFVAVCLLCAVPCASADPANQGGDPAAAPAASEVSLPNAPCGDALAWSFDAASGALTVSGSGPMYDWASSEDVPWRAIRDQVTSVVVGEGVTAVGDRAFFGMRYLASVSLPSTVASIGEGAFGNALDLGQIVLPAGLASIGDAAFGMCGLTSVAIPDSVAQMGERVFMSCPNLTEVVWSAGLAEVPAWTFHGCGLLASVSIPSGVQQIGTLAFYGCTNLQRVFIPASVVKIGDYAFSDEVSSTVTVYYGGTREAWPTLFDPAVNAGIAYAAIEFEAAGLGTDASTAAVSAGLAAYAYRTDTLPAFYPASSADANTITTLYDLGGLYVTNVSDVVYGDLDEALGSYRSETFSFDVYSTLPYDVVVDVYDTNGEWAGSARVEGHAGAQAGVTPESLGVSYTDPSVSTLTHVTVTQPSPGYVLLSANPAQSMGTFYENAALCLVAGVAQTYGGADDPAVWEAVSDALVDGLAAVLTDGEYPFGADELRQTFSQAAYDAAASYAVGSTGAAAEALARSLAEVLDALAGVEMVDGAAVDWRSQISSALGVDAAALAALDPSAGLGIAAAPAFGEGGALAAAVASLCSATGAPVAVVGSSGRSSSVEMAGVEVSYESGTWESEVPTVVLNVDEGADPPEVADADGTLLGFAAVDVYDVFSLTADQQRRDLAGSANVSLPVPAGSRAEDCIVLRRVSEGGTEGAAVWEVVESAPRYGDFGDPTFSTSAAGIYAVVDTSTAYDAVAGNDASADAIELPERRVEVYATAASLTVDVGEQLGLVCTLRGSDGQTLAWDAPLVAVADGSVAQASAVGQGPDEASYALTLTGLSEGSTEVTVTDAASGAAATFAVTVGDGPGGYAYYLDDVPAFYPDSFGEDELLTNFYNVNGLYVSGYSATRNTDGSWAVSFDVYNSRYYSGSVDVYDADGTWVASRRIEKYADISGLWDTGESAVYLIRDLVGGVALSYRADAGQQHTHVDVTVPAGGRLAISNAAAQSPGAFLYNAAEFLMRGVEAMVDVALGDVDCGVAADGVVDAVVADDAVREAFCEQFTKMAYGIGETATTVGVADAVEAMANDVEGLFADMGFDWKGVAQAATGVAEGVFEAATGPVGAALKGMFALTEITNATVQAAQLCDGLNAPVVVLFDPDSTAAGVTIRGEAVVPTVG